ncbi:hypothetical protein [Vibrio splendidus]
MSQTLKCSALLNQDIADDEHPKIAKKGLSRFSEEVYLIESDA